MDAPRDVALAPQQRRRLVQRRQPLLQQHARHLRVEGALLLDRRVALGALEVRDEAVDEALRQVGLRDGERVRAARRLVGHGGRGAGGGRGLLRLLRRRLPSSSRSMSKCQ